MCGSQSAGFLADTQTVTGGGAALCLPTLAALAPVDATLCRGGPVLSAALRQSRLLPRPARQLTWWEACPVHSESEGSIPGQGTCLPPRLRVWAPVGTHMGGNRLTFVSLCPF